MGYFTDSIENRLLSVGGIMEDSMNTSRVMKKGRNRWEIIRDIFKAILEDKKIKKTRIMQKAYLDWRTFNRYFEYLLNEGFMVKRNLDEVNREEHYVITEKGKGFLKKLKDLEEVVC